MIDSCLTHALHAPVYYIYIYIYVYIAILYYTYIYAMCCTYTSPVPPYTPMPIHYLYAISMPHLYPIPMPYYTPNPIYITYASPIAHAYPLTPLCLSIMYRYYELCLNHALHAPIYSYMPYLYLTYTLLHP